METIVGESVSENGGFRSGKFSRSVFWKIVAEFFVKMGNVIVNLKGTGVEVGTGTGDNGIANARQGPGDEDIVPVKEHDILAARLFDAAVPGGGTAAAARRGAHTEARIRRGEFTRHGFAGIFRVFDFKETFPIATGLLKNGLQALAKIGFHVATGSDDGKEWCCFRDG